VAGFFLLGAAWALASPLLSGPDEPAHIVRAEAIVRGQLIGRPLSPNPDYPFTSVLVPGFLENVNRLTYWCYLYDTAHTARCAPPLSGPNHLVAVTTYVGHYPPLYYEAVGWPSLLAGGTAGVLLMRIVSAFINSVLLATALWLALRRSRVLVLAILAAVTPAVMFFSGSVNPSGMEMASAVCFWCALLGLTMPWAVGAERAGGADGGADDGAGRGAEGDDSAGRAGGRGDRGVGPAGEMARAGGRGDRGVGPAGEMARAGGRGDRGVGPAGEMARAGGRGAPLPLLEVVVAAVSGCVLALTRGLSPAWVVVALVAALFSGDGGRMRQLARSRSVRVAGCVLVLAMVAAVTWIVAEHGLDELGLPNHASYASLFHQALADTPKRLMEMIGLFGTNNVSPPVFATTTAVSVLGVLVVGALIVGSWRERLVLASLLIAIVAVPIAINVVTGRHYGVIWQGRYTMPIGVGAPILAGYVLGAWFERGRRRVGRRAGSGAAAGAGVGAGSFIRVAGVGAVVLAVGLATAQFSSLLWDLRRFMVGVNGPLSGVFGGIWHPPVDGFVLLIAGAVGSLTVALLTLRASSGRDASAAARTPSSVL
jgi:hypothetical protein